MFDQLKLDLVRYSVLSYPIHGKDIILILDTDASLYAIGAVLSQVQNRHGTVIAYASKTLSGAQCVYCTLKRELLAEVYFTKHF